MRFLNFIIIIIVVTVFSCKKDSGNYDYSIPSDFSILRDSLPASYQVQQGKETLTIDPTLLAADTSDFEYLWRVFQTDLQYPKFFKYDTIGTQRVLKSLINAEPGTTNNIELKVTQKSTGLFKFYTFPVTTITDVPLGWMVAYEKNGETDIDIVRYPRLLGGTNKDTVYRQQLKAGLGGKRLPGTALNLVSGVSTGQGVFLLSSTSGIVHLEGNSFNMLSNFNQLFLGNAPVVSPVQFMHAGLSAGTTLFYVNNGNIYWSYQSAFVGTGIFANGDKYRAAPWLAPGLGNALIFYDEIGKRFLNMAQNATLISSFTPPTSGTHKFVLNNIGKELVWMDGGVSSYKFAIFKNTTGTARFLYVLSNTANTPTIALVPTLGNLPEIQNAKFFQVSLAAANVFYATNKKVYSFLADYNTDSYSNVRESFTAPADEEITCINLIRTGNSLTTGRKMCIATYNEKTQTGKMYVYDVTPITGEFGAAPLFETTHDGRITVMENKRN